MFNQLIIDRHFQDLNPLLFGSEECEPEHSFGPAIRPYYLIHYVERGQGVFETGGKVYPVHAGEAFLILPEKITRYTADRQNPWSYRWIGFNGSLASRFDTLPPVFPLDTSAFPDYRDADGVNPEFGLASALFRLCAALFDPHDSTKQQQCENGYVRRMQNYLRLSFMQSDLRVETVASQMHLNRRYLSRLFRAETGLTPQEFLISVRMQAADRYLRQGISVSETAKLCGYADVFNFSKMFKKFYGVAPSKR